MHQPDKALVHFTTPEDWKEFVDFGTARGYKSWVERTRNRKWSPEMCARLERGRFRSFGNMRIYNECQWKSYRADMDPAFEFCSAHQYIALVSGCYLAEDDTVPDLQDLL